MKELVDRILNGEAVDIAESNPHYYLSVSQEGCEYKIGFANPKSPSDHCFARLDIKTIKEAGNLLIKLADELDSRKKFKDGDNLYAVTPIGGVFWASFNSGFAEHLGLVMSGNAFKTKEEACDNIPAVMAKYQYLRDRGLV